MIIIYDYLLLLKQNYMNKKEEEEEVIKGTEGMIYEKKKCK